MKKKVLILLCSAFLISCGGSDSDNNSGLIGEDITGVLTSLGADGWAGTSLEITGGNDAMPANIYRVSTRLELI